jgi:hypothetical protein
MRELTVIVLSSTARSEVVPIDGERRCTGGGRRKGTTVLRRLRASELDSSCTVSLSRVLIMMVSTARLGNAPNGGDGRSL